MNRKKEESVCLCVCECSIDLLCSPAGGGVCNRFTAAETERKKKENNYAVNKLHSSYIVYLAYLCMIATQS